MKKALLFFGFSIGFLLIYLLAVILLATTTYYQLTEREGLSVNNNKQALTDSTYTALIWNIGYGGLGAESVFFIMEAK